MDDPVPVYTVRGLSSQGASWRSLPGSRHVTDGARLAAGGVIPSMTIQAVCSKKKCEYHLRKLRQSVEGRNLPSGHLYCYAIARSEHDFLTFSREENPSFRGNLCTDILDRRRSAGQAVATCPSIACQRQVFTEDGPLLKTIGFTNCQFRISYDVVDGRSVQTYHIPEQTSRQPAFLSVDQDHHCTLLSPTFSGVSLAKTKFGSLGVQVEMRCPPSGINVNAVCEASDPPCPIARANTQLQDSQTSFKSQCTLGLNNPLKIHLERGSLVTVDRTLSCDYCQTRFSPQSLESFSLTRCLWKLSTPQLSHPWMFSFSAEGCLSEVNLKASQLRSAGIFPLELQCHPIPEESFIVQGPCSNGRQCPLQNAELKAILPASSFQACCDLSVAIGDTYDDAEPSPFFSEVFLSDRFRCGACFASGCEGTIDPHYITCYRVRYEYTYQDKNDQLGRMPEQSRAVYAADGASSYKLNDLAAAKNTRVSSLAFLPFIP